MSICSRCFAEIPEPDLEEAIRREADFRENFPNTWDKQTRRVLVCQKCFEEMQENTSDYERSQL